LQRGQVQAAAETVRTLLRAAPKNTEALYLLAVCERYLRHPQEALETLVQLLDCNPTYARAYQEIGHNQRALDRPAEACKAYAQAVALNPGLVASWKQLVELHTALGDKEEAENAHNQLERLQSLPKELVSVSSMIHEGRLYRAERLCRSFLQANQHHVEAMRLLAELGKRLQVLDDAEFLLESCVEFEPDNLLARFDYANVLHRRQKYDRALEQATLLRESDPGRPAFEMLYANECLSVGRYDDALAVYDELIAARPNLAGTWLVRGHALKTVGRYEDALESYHGAVERRPEFGDAWWSMANLKTYRFTSEEVALMRECEISSSTPLTDRFHLCFALGKALEDGDGGEPDYKASFWYYERGNALKKDETRYRPERIERDFRLQKEVCDAAFMAERTGQGCPDPDPIFIVGMPRAGSTLLEQILASHSQVDGTMELPNILALAHRLDGRRRAGDEPRYPAVLANLDPGRLRSLGKKYIEDTRFHRAGAPYFIDKMPNNFRHIGLIHLILPNAKIIDARREPMACCFSNFKQLFAEGQEFTYGLDEVGRYYRAYVNLMEHWDGVMPGKVLRVQYEDVVDDLERQVHRILDHCGLPFEEACLNFHETRRAVRTPSSEQVRQPIYSDGLEQWRHFEPYLEPLATALEGHSTSR